MFKRMNQTTIKAALVCALMMIALAVVPESAEASDSIFDMETGFDVFLVVVFVVGVALAIPMVL